METLEQAGSLKQLLVERLEIVIADISIIGGTDVLDLSVGHTNPIANYLRTVEQCGGMVRESTREAILNQEIFSCTGQVAHSTQVFTSGTASKSVPTIEV
jgi:hypothetical protein